MDTDIVVAFYSRQDIPFGLFLSRGIPPVGEIVIGGLGVLRYLKNK